MGRCEGKTIDWAGPSWQLSLDPEWAVPATDKIFLTFPDDKFEILAIRLNPLTPEQWLAEVKQNKEWGQIHWIDRETSTFLSDASVEPLPDIGKVGHTIVNTAFQGKFDELEHWLERYHDVPQEPFGLAEEQLYDWLSDCIPAWR